MASQRRTKRKAQALRELAAMADRRADEMPPLKRLEDGPTQRGIAKELRKTADEVENRPADSGPTS